MSFTDTQGWDLAYRTDEVPVRYVWHSADGGTTVTYIEDPYVGVPYFLVNGNKVGRVSRSIRDRLDIWTYEESAEILAGAVATRDKIDGLYLSALTVPQGHVETVVAEFRRLSGDEDPEVRHALLVAIGYMGENAQLRSLAEEMRVNDPDQNVRRDAGYLIEGLDTPDS